jgi:hypothetical protein
MLMLYVRRIPELLIVAKLVLPGDWFGGRALEIARLTKRESEMKDFENILTFR